MHIQDNAQAPYLHALVIALLQLGRMYMTSSPVLVQLIPPTLKARSAHVRQPPCSIRFTDVALYPSFLPNRTMAICGDIHYLHIHIPHSYQIFVQAYKFTLTSHYVYTGLRRGSIPACLLAHVIALLQLGTMYMTSLPVLV